MGTISPPLIRNFLLTNISCIRQRSIPWQCAQKVLHWERQQTGKHQHTYPIISTHQAPRIFNFMVVEITPPGIRTLHWRFYIIWCVFNFSFIPIGNNPSPLKPFFLQ